MNVKMVLGMVVGLLMGMASVDAFTHIVGGSHGWRVPDNKTFFQDWAQPRTFGVGDRLVFPYRPGSNNIVAVNKTDFDTCGQEHVINMYFLGPTIINYTAPGDYYYYCGIGKHCEAGQKLHVHVTSGPGSSGSDPLPFNLDKVGVSGDTLANAINNASPAAAPAAATADAAVKPSGAVRTVSGGVFFVVTSFVMSRLFF